MNESLLALIISILAVGLSCALLTFARRYNNKSPNVGEGTVWWTMFIITVIVFVIIHIAIGLVYNSWK